MRRKQMTTKQLQARVTQTRNVLIKQYKLTKALIESNRSVLSKSCLAKYQKLCDKVLSNAKDDPILARRLAPKKRRKME